MIGRTERDPEDYTINLPEHVLAVFVARYPSPPLQPSENPPDDTICYNNNAQANTCTQLLNGSFPMFTWGNAF